MTIAIPSPSTLAQRFAAGLAQQEFTASDGTTVRLDATAPQTLEQALSILFALADYETYLYVRDIGIELMVSTATLEGLLPQHAAIWGVPRRGATAAAGFVIVQSVASASVTLPIGTLFTVDGSAQWWVTAATTIAPGAAASVPVMATETGEGGNLSPNVSAQLVSPIVGVQSVAVDQDGISGGAPIEAVDSWRSRIIAVIREPYGGGTANDYAKWATAAGAAYVNVVPEYGGLGTVGIVVIMSGPLAPTPAQLESIQTYIDARRPVRGNATVYAGEIVPQNPVIALNPDTVALRSAVTGALAATYRGVGIGGTIYVQALDAAIIAVAGSQNDLIAPQSDQTLAANQMPILGAIQWQTGS